MPRRNFVVILWLIGLVMVCIAAFSYNAGVGMFTTGIALMLTAVMTSGD